MEAMEGWYRTRELRPRRRTCVVIVFELDSVEAAKRYTNDFPLTKAGFLEWFFISVQVPLPIEVLVDSKVDTKQPYDRTTEQVLTQGAP